MVALLILVLTVFGAAPGRAATLEAFADFSPRRTDFDGNVMIGSGSPGNRWEDGTWMQVSSNLIDLSADGMNFTGGDPGFTFYRFTVSGGSLQSTPLNEMVAGGAISPGGGTVLGAVDYPHPTDFYASTQAASWTGSNPTRYRYYDDGECLPWSSTYAFIVTNADILGMTELFRCGGGPPVVDRYHLTRWPGPSRVGDGRIVTLAASDDGSVIVARGPSEWFFLRGGGAFVPVPEELGCSIYVLSANAGVAAGSQCLWTAAAGWRLLVDVLRDAGADVDGWSDFAVSDVSGDGNVVVGGARRDGVQVGFRAVLDGDETGLVVNVTGDEPNHADSRTENVCDVDRTEDGEQCTLRAAIELANERGGGTIAFDIPGGGVPIIDVGRAGQGLPALAAPIELDATTQPGTGRVILRGPQSEDNPPSTYGLSIEGSGSVIRGLVVFGFTDGGVGVSADRCRISDNVIGTDVQGTVALGNGPNTSGLSVVANDTVIENNLLAGGDTELFLLGARNLVQGNRIGVGATGQPIERRDDPQREVLYLPLVVAGEDNVVGLPLAGGPARRPAVCTHPCNVISAAQIGAPNLPPSSRNVIAGNFINADPSGLPFSSDYVNTPLCVVRVTDGQGHQVVGNLIGGVNSSVTALDRTSVCVGGDYIDGSLREVADVAVTDNEIKASHTVGVHVYGWATDVIISRNAIADHLANGIRLGAQSDQGPIRADILDNDISGSGVGILIFSSLGETQARIAQNRVARNGQGIGLHAGSSGNPRSRALISRNSIFANDIGIDLGLDGVTPNEQFDGDTGPNDLQNFAVVHAVSSAGGTLTLEGFLPTPFTATAPYTLEVFSNSRCSDGGWAHGQGERYLGAVTVAPSLGDAEFAATIDGVPDDHRFLSLTASEPALGITSEFSRCVGVGGADEVAQAEVPDDATGVVLDAQGVTTAVRTSAAAGAAAGRRNAVPGAGKLYVTRYEYAPEVSVFADATAPAVGGTAVRPDAVGARYWYLADRNLTLAGGAAAPRTFEVCLDPTDVVRPVALRSVVVVRRDEATSGEWVPYPTTRGVRDDGTVYLCAADLPALGEFALGGAPAAFSDGPPDACTPSPGGPAGARCACDTLPPIACDTLPAAIEKATAGACGKLAQAVGESNPKKLKRLLRGASKGFKKAGKKLERKPGSGLSDACRTSLGETLRQAQERLAD